MKEEKRIRIPYKYKGALDPKEDKHVCVSRKDVLDNIIDHVDDGEYVLILGPRQIGKTTLLRQFQERYKNKGYVVYVSLETVPKTIKGFYRWLRSKLSKSIPIREKVKQHSFLEEERVQFKEFLADLHPENDKRIVLAFDEIMGIPEIRDFLHLWRSVYESRHEVSGFNNISFIATGNDALLSIISEHADGENLFNIPEIIYIKDFSDLEAVILIDISFSNHGIEIASSARAHLISQLSGHPQMLQHLCYCLMNKGLKDKRKIEIEDVESCIREELFLKNLSLITLGGDINTNSGLKKLVKEILKGTPCPFIPNRRFMLAGAGAIGQSTGDTCIIRNKMYERYLLGILKDELQAEGITNISHNSQVLQTTISTVDTENLFTFKHQLGEGSMGDVFLAVENGLDRLVAIKKLKNPLLDDGEIERFNREAKAIASLRHENIVVIYRYQKIKGDHCIVMEYIDGKDLSRTLKDRHKTLTLDDIICFSKKLFRTLNYAHENNVIHRDIKPKNIMIDKRGIVKIVDFGIAKLKNVTTSGESNQFMGTPLYMPPEQFFNSNVGHQADIYSAGVTLFQFITGDVPFKGRSWNELREKHLNDPIPSIKDGAPHIKCWKELDAIIARCMAKKIEDRYQNANDVVNDMCKLEKGPMSDTMVIDIIRGWL